MASGENVSTEGNRPLYSSSSELNTTDPVRDGELIVQETDLFFPGRGIPYEFRRSYRSRTGHYGVLGYGWDHNYNRRILQGNACGAVDLLTGDSGRLRFAVALRTEDFVRYDAPAGVPLRLKKIIDRFEPTKTIWSMRSAEGLTYIFDWQGLLSRISDDAGNSLAFEWEQVYDNDNIVPIGSDLEWRIRRVTDTTSRSIYYNYQQGSSSGLVGPALFLECLSLEQNCNNPLVRFTVERSYTGTFANIFPVPDFGNLLTVLDSNGVGHSYVYQHQSTESVYLADSLAEEFCSSACAPASSCESLSLCDRAPSACLDYFDQQVKANPSFDTRRTCIDSLLDEAGCTRQRVDYPYPLVQDPYCSKPSGRDYGCASTCEADIARASQPWHSSFWAGDVEIYLFNVNTHDAIHLYCNEYCHASAVCTGSTIDLCRAIQRGTIPFCTDNCHDDCRARYQARNPGGQSVHTFGRPEELEHNLTEIHELPGNRLVLKNTYGTDPADPSFDRVISQQLGEGLQDPAAQNKINFYYFDLTVGVAATNSARQGFPAIDYVDDLSSFKSVEVCPARCVRKTHLSLGVPPVDRRLPQLSVPPKPLLDVGWVRLDRQGTATVRLVIPPGQAIKGLGPWVIGIPGQGTVRIVPATSPGEFAVQGDEKTLTALFRGSRQALLWSDARGLYFQNGQGKGRLASPTKLGNAPETGLLTSRLGILIEPTGRSTLRTVAIGAPPGRVIRLWTQAGPVELIATGFGGSFRLRGPAAVVKSLGEQRSQTVFLTKDGELWLLPDLIERYIERADIGPRLFLARYIDIIDHSFLGPGDTCVQWAYSDSQELGGAKDPQLPTRAVVVADLHGVVRTEYYDAQGRLIREVNHHAVDGRPKEIVDYNYDPISGAVRGIRYPDGRRHCEECNSLSQPLQVSDLPAAGAPGAAAPVVTLLAYDLEHLTDITLDPDSPTPFTVHYEHDWPSGRILSIQAQVDSTHQQVTKFQYDPAPTLGPRKITQSDGSVVTLDDYTAVGPGTITVDSGGPDPLITAIVYDENGRIQQRKRFRHLAATRTFFDVRGLLTKSTRVAPSGTLLDTIYQYAGSHLPRQISTSLATTTLEHDSLGHLQWDAETAIDAPGRATCWNYGPDGRLESVLQAEGGLTNYYYDDAGRVTRIERGLPNSIPAWVAACRAALQSNGLPVPGPGATAVGLETIQRIEYDLSGLPSLVTDGSKVGVRYVRDGLGRVIDMIDGNDNHLRRGYDARGRVVWEASYGPNPPPYDKPQGLAPGVPLESMIEYDYDNLNRIVQTLRWHFVGTEPVSPGKLKIATRITYDDDHARVSISQDGRAPTVMEFDGAGRLRSITLPNKNVKKADYREDGIVGDYATWSFTGQDGQLRSATVFYDDEGRLSKVADAPHVPARVINVYDDFGRPLSRLVGGHIQTTYSFDGFDQLRSITEGTDTGARSIALRHDGQGRLQSFTDASSATTSYVFDGAGRIDHVLHPSGGTTSWKYVPGSTRPSSRTDAFGAVFSFGYDPSGRILSEHLTHSGGLQLGDGIDRLFTYTPSGQIKTAGLAGNPANPTNGSVITFSYDSLGNPVAEESSLSPLVIAQTWSAIGVPTAIRLSDRSDPSRVAFIERNYDDLARLVSTSINGRLVATLGHEATGGGISFGHGAVVSQPSFDQIGRWVSTDIKTPGGLAARIRDAVGPDGIVRERQRSFAGLAPLTDFYQIDSGGRLVAENLLVPDIAPIPDIPTEITDAAIDPFFTDPARQGVSFRTYTLDGLANWTSRRDVQGTLVTSFNTVPQGLNQYQTLGRDTNGMPLEWSYDSAADVMQIGADQYVFDARALLAQAVVGGGKLQFGYDALGRRANEQDSSTGESRSIVWNGPVIAAVGPSSSASSQVVRVPGDRTETHLALVEQLGEGNITYLHSSGDGSILASTNDSGLLEGYSYSGYGETTFFDGAGQIVAGADGPSLFSSHSNRFLFQGQFYDPLMRTYSMGAREYRPDVGRFLSLDPVGVGGGENLYAFVMGKPLVFSDPSGMSPVHTTFSTRADPSWLGLLAPYDRAAYEGPVLDAVTGRTITSIGPPVATSGRTNPANMALRNYTTGTEGFRTFTGAVFGGTAQLGGLTLDQAFHAAQMGTLIEGLAGSFTAALSVNRLQSQMSTPYIGPERQLPPHVDVVDEAMAGQRYGPYIPDTNWKPDLLPRGTIVGRASPGPGNFFTDEATATTVSNPEAYRALMQVYPDENHPTRPYMEVYYITPPQGWEVARGTTGANTGAGPGGGTEYFIPSRGGGVISEPIGRWPMTLVGPARGLLDSVKIGYYQGFEIIIGPPVP
jgi:RHS repeat-associated protein